MGRLLVAKMGMLQTNITGRISELLFVLPNDRFGIVNKGPGWSGVS